MTNKKDLVANVRTDLEKSVTLKEIEDLKVKYLGKKGAITKLLKTLGSLPPDDRKQAGIEIHTAKSQIDVLFSRRLEDITSNLIDEKIRKGTVDVTLPARSSGLKGSSHPIQLTLEKIIDIFCRLGFECQSGPEIEDEFHNFEALNISDNHPARDMHDTFYVSDNKLLRTHTSSVQIRSMMVAEPPLKIMTPGKVYRCDSDPTHSPMFHQIEGLHIDENINFGHLKGTLIHFIKEFFGKEMQIRFRPSYFPFTEPSAEIDIKFKGKWLEVLGCGMVHPNVLSNVNIDNKKYTGFAFGLGVERLTMLRHSITDLRMFYDNDISFLSQFKDLK